MFASRGFRIASLFTCLFLVFSVASVDQAEARRGGSFGSRGIRTQQAPAPTNTAPTQTAPIQRTTTPNAQPANNAAANAAQGQNRGFMGGFGGSMLRGLMLGGLLGMLFGGGFGGLGGILAAMAQVVIIGGIIALVFAFLRKKNAPQAAGVRGANIHAYQENKPNEKFEFSKYFNGNLAGGSAGAASGAGANAKTETNELGLGQADLESFQSLLSRVQSAYSAENYSALRVLTTPEMMSYLTEELAINASNEVKNQVSDVTLLQGDLSESWSEGTQEYATAAMRYSAIDYTIERKSGRVVEGRSDVAEETTELWTFTRPRGGEWILSAIQEA